jgi:hypothetical protein
VFADLVADVLGDVEGEQRVHGRCSFNLVRKRCDHVGVIGNIPGGSGVGSGPWLRGLLGPVPSAAVAAMSVPVNSGVAEILAGGGDAAGEALVERRLPRTDAAVVATFTRGLAAAPMFPA